MRVVRCTAALLALALFLGLHWTLLQTVAWTRMLVEFSRTTSLGTALAMTFDAKHRCELCLAVQRGRDAERARQGTAGVERPALEYDLPAPGPAVTPPPRPDVAYPAVVAVTSRTDPPPRPRPRTPGAA